MIYLYKVVGVRWIKRNDIWVCRKRTDFVTPDKMTAEMIADYLNSTQTKYEYHINSIEQYDSFRDYLFYNE